MQNTNKLNPRIRFHVRLQIMLAPAFLVRIAIHYEQERRGTPLESSSRKKIGPWLSTRLNKEDTF